MDFGVVVVVSNEDRKCERSKKREEKMFEVNSHCYYYKISFSII